MKRILKLKATDGIQSRQIEGSFALYNKNGAYSWRRMGKDILINAPAPRSEVHPWKTRVKWYDEMKTFGGIATSGFGAMVEPGFVNGIDPVAVSAYSDSPLIADVERQGIFRKSPGLLDRPVIPLIDLTENGEFNTETFAEVVLNKSNLEPEELNAGFDEGTVKDPRALGAALTSVELPKAIKQIVINNFSEKQYESGYYGAEKKRRDSMLESRFKDEGSLGAGIGNVEISAFITWIYVRMAINTSVTMPVAPNLSHFALLSAGLVGATAAVGIEGARQGLPKSITNTSGPTTSVWRDRPQIAVGWKGFFGKETIFSNYPIAEIYMIVPKGASFTNASGIGGGSAAVIPYVRNLCYWNLQFRVNRAMQSPSIPTNPPDEFGKHQWFI